MIKKFYAVCLIVIMMTMSGCAAMQVALEKKDLKVENLMSDTIFLDIENQPERTVFVDVRNTSDKNLNIGTLIKEKITQRGYQVINNPKKAGYILQVNVLQVGKADPSALKSSVYSGYGGTLAAGLGGAAIGAAAGGGVGAAYGAGAGVLVGGAAELIAGSLVKDVTYSIMTDVMISEKTDAKVVESQQANISRGKNTKVTQTIAKSSNRQRYQTRVASTANQVNLELNEALPSLEQGLSQSIAGIF